MDSPADAARRILLGTGLGLLVVTGLLLSIGLLPPANCTDEEFDCIEISAAGWAIPAAAAFCLGLGGMLKIRPDVLAGLFPETTDAQRAAMIDAQLESEIDDSQLGGAWATLEEKMLSSKLEEE